VLLVDAYFLAELGGLLVLMLMLVLLLPVLLRWLSLALFKYSDVLSIGLASLSRLLDVDREGFLTFRVTFPPCLW